MANPNAQSKPLSGLRVVEFASMVAGPLCTRILFDMGAEVIKVEGSDGDFMRSQEPLRDGRSTFFGHMNYGKKSICLDLKRAEGAEIALQVMARSDVVVENFRPTVMERLGLGYGAVRAMNPGAVYCSISGYGQTGAQTARPAFAQMIHAASGYDMAHLSYQRTQDSPANVSVFLADVLSASFAATAIQGALIKRHATGVGENIDVTLMESMLNLLILEVQQAQVPNQQPRVSYRPIRTADGFVMAVLITQKNFEDLCDAIGQEALKTDPMFANPDARRRNWDALMTIIETWSGNRTSAQCEQILVGRGIPSSSYRTVSEMMSDPDLLARETFATVADRSGEFLVPRLPFRSAGEPMPTVSLVPDLGEHGPQILETLLQVGKDRIAALVEMGILGQGAVMLAAA